MRKLLAACALSIVLHCLLFFGSAWQLPEAEEVFDMPLAARLLPAQPEPLVQPPPTTRLPTQLPPVAALAPPLPELPQLDEGDMRAPVPLEQGEDEVPAPVELAHEPPLPEPPAQVAKASSVDWPKQGCIKFVLGVKVVLDIGDVGQAEQCWRHDGNIYQATLKGQASALLRSFHLEETASGHFRDGQMVADRFDEIVDKRRYETIFEPPGQRIRQNRNGNLREVQATGMALDMVSLMHFLGRLPEGVEAFDVFTVALRGSVSRVTVVQRPVAPLVLPGGSIAARQFHAETRGGELKIDIWIAPEWRNLPVRLRINDRDNVFDFRAVSLQADGQDLMRFN